MNVFCIPCCAPSGSSSTAAAAARPGHIPQNDPKSAYAARPVKNTPTGARTPANTAYECSPDACRMRAGVMYAP